MIIKYVLLSILGLFILLNILFGSVYNEGDTISAEHQNIIFEQCYGSDVGVEIKLSDYLGKILWIDCKLLFISDLHCIYLFSFVIFLALKICNKHRIAAYLKSKEKQLVAITLELTTIISIVGRVIMK